MLEYYLEPPSNQELAQLILNELIDQLNQLFKKAGAQIEKAFRNLTVDIIKQSEFIHSLTDFQGDLRGEFGLRIGSEDRIAQVIINNIGLDTYLLQTPVTYFGGNFSGGLALAVGQNLFAALKNLSEGKTFTEKGETVPWLEWTLERGNAVTIADHSVYFKIGKGRSGLAIMIPNNAIGWRIPPQFSGTDHDNWITREILKNLDKYEQVLSNILARY